MYWSLATHLNVALMTALHHARLSARSCKRNLEETSAVPALSEGWLLFNSTQELKERRREKKRKGRRDKDQNRRRAEENPF